jgi:LemA protein
MKRSVIVFGCLGVLVVAVLLVGGLVALSYNGMVGRAQAVDQSWAQVQNVYQRRADLVPNLVATVSGAANF